MDAKRTKNTATLTIGSTEELPVNDHIHDHNNAKSEPQYAYATGRFIEEDAESVATLNSDTDDSTEVIIIDEHERAMTLKEFLQDDNTTPGVEAVEEEADTIFSFKEILQLNKENMLQHTIEGKRKWTYTPYKLGRAPKQSHWRP